MLSFKELLKKKLFWISLAILASGILLNNLTSMRLQEKYGNSLPVLNDLLLDRIPFFNIMWLYDLFIISAVLLMIYYAWKEERHLIPYFLIVFGIFQFTRGVFIVLTPFGSPNAGAIGLFNGSVFRNGVYPSGHTGAAFMAYLFLKDNYKVLSLFLLVGVMSTLLLGRGHYSIDIFSAILFTYAIYGYSEKYLKERFTIQK